MLRQSHIIYVSIYINCATFFFNDAPTTDIYTLSLHDALPICTPSPHARCGGSNPPCPAGRSLSGRASGDRKSTRLNSSHLVISYAVFCLKKKNKIAHQKLSRECHNGSRNEQLNSALSANREQL